METAIFAKLPSSGATEWWSAGNSEERFTQGAVPYTARVSHSTTTEVSPKKRRVEYMSALKYAVYRIDETAMIYTESMLDVAMRLLKQEWLQFVTSEPGTSFLGSKKCRFIVSWLSGNRVEEVATKNVTEFLQWMLDDTQLQTVCHKGNVMIVQKNDI